MTVFRYPGILHLPVVTGGGAPTRASGTLQTDGCYGALVHLPDCLLTDVPLSLTSRTRLTGGYTYKGITVPPAQWHWRGSTRTAVLDRCFTASWYPYKCTGLSGTLNAARRYTVQGAIVADDIKVTADADGGDDGGEEGYGPYRTADGRVLSMNDGAEREEGAAIVNIAAVAQRLGDELRGGKAYSPQRIRALVAQGWLGLYRRNVGDDDEPYYSWFIADGKGGRQDTVSEFVHHQRTNPGSVRSGAGVVTVSKAPDGAVKLPDGFSAPDGMTLVEVLAALAAANGLTFRHKAGTAATGPADSNSAVGATEAAKAAEQERRKSGSQGDTK